MIPYLLEAGPIKISTIGVFLALSFVLSSFLLWRNLRDDYPEEGILTLTIYLFILGTIGARLVYIMENFGDFGFNIDRWFFWNRYPGFSFLGGVLGGFFFLSWWSRKKSWDFWLIADWATFAFLMVGFLSGLGGYFSTGQRFDLFRLSISAVTLVLAIFFHYCYRKFSWYKSGMLGFVACLSLAIFFIGLGILELLLRSGIYWEKFIWWFLGLTALLLLYKRSGRSWREDLRICKRK